MFFVDMVSSLNEREDQYNVDERTPFQKACETGNVDLVKALIDASETKDINLNAVCSSGLTASMMAARRGHYEVLKLLFERSKEMMIDLAAVCNQNGNVFTWAFHGDSPEIFDLILKHHEIADIQLEITDVHGS